ncbi:MAG: gamma-glutamyl-gamma-aminobutyrate hydrolase family protein [Clostridia bacterium]|nr:gamma-glutamyl-gamma-aminobutyrate hydrolase family protein [Clostridia bacterium]
MKPLIAITPQYDNYLGINKISPFYAKAVEESGGIPIILPYTRNDSVIEETVSRLDGIIFSGGTNIDPQKYGETAQANCGNIEFERDIFELKLCKFATDMDKSVLGICRGCQLLTVAADGTLHQHIENHDQTADKHITTHTVKILPDTPLQKILGADLTDVNSFHHQTVKALGSLKIAAQSEDGTIEAVYAPGKKFHLGIQWHPERMYSTNIHAKLIFDSFISSCC